MMRASSTSRPLGFASAMIPPGYHEHPAIRPAISCGAMRAASLSPSPSRRWLTRANALSLSRLAIAPALALAIGSGHRLAAAALLLLAIASDFADGAVARRYGEASPLGGLVDHATDATLDVLGLSGPGPAWMRPAGWVFVASTLVSMLDRLTALLRSRDAQRPSG